MISQAKLKNMFSGMGSEPVVKELLEGAIKLDKKKVGGHIAKEVAKLCSLEIEKERKENFGDEYFEFRDRLRSVREGTARHQEIENHRVANTPFDRVTTTPEEVRGNTVMCAVCRRPVEDYQIEHLHFTREIRIWARCHGREHYQSMTPEIHEDYHMRQGVPIRMFVGDAQRLNRGDHEREADRRERMDREERYSNAMRSGRAPRSRAEAERLELEQQEDPYYRAINNRGFNGGGF